MTWQAVWIGVASSSVAAGLVDGSALWEARRKEQAVLDLAGDRVGRLHQNLLRLLDATFGGELGSDAARPQKLRSLSTWKYDPNSPAQVVPPMTRQVLVEHYVSELDNALDTALSLGTTTTEASRFVRLDAVLRSSVFMQWLRHGSGFSMQDESGTFAADAADVLEDVQVEFRFFAKRGRPGWKFGALKDV